MMGGMYSMRKAGIGFFAALVCGLTLAMSGTASAATHFSGHGADCFSTPEVAGQCEDGLPATMNFTVNNAATRVLRFRVDYDVACGTVQHTFVTVRSMVIRPNLRFSSTGSFDNNDPTTGARLGTTTVTVHGRFTRGPKARVTMEANTT